MQLIFLNTSIMRHFEFWKWSPIHKHLWVQIWLISNWALRKCDSHNQCLLVRDFVQGICKWVYRQSVEKKQNLILKVPFSYCNHIHFPFHSLSPNFCNKWGKSLLTHLVHNPNFIPICIEIDDDIARQKGTWSYCWICITVQRNIWLRLEKKL